MSDRKVKIIAMIITMCFVLAFSVNVIRATGTISIPSPTGGTTTQKINSSSGIVLGVIQAVAIAAAVIMLIVLAIKYVTAAPTEKADVKKSAAIYVLGAVLLFGASGILGIIQSFSTEVVGSGAGESGG